MAQIPLPAKIKLIKNSSGKRVKILGYTGVAVDLSDHGFYEPVIYDLSNASVKTHIPYYYDHQELIGHTIENNIFKDKVEHIADLSLIHI